MKKLFILFFLCPVIVLHGQEIEKETDQKWRFNLMGGMGYMTANTDDAVSVLESSYGVNKSDAEDYYKSLKLRSQGSAEIHYLFHENWGVGAKYQLFSTSNSLDDVKRLPLTIGFDVIHTHYAEHLYINYAGPSVFTRRSLDFENKWQLVSALSIGYSLYRDEVTIESNERYIPMLLTGKTVGGTLDIGIEYFVSKNCAIGINAGLFYSSFKKLKIRNELGTINQSIDKGENVSRMDISLGIRLYK